MRAIVSRSFFILYLLAGLLVVGVLSACSGDQPEPDSPSVIRGMKGFKVTATANSEVRRYPSVVQPARESKLSFEVGGRLKDIRLEVGQRVAAGQLLAEIDPVSLKLKAQQAKASLNQAEASYRNAKLDFDRKEPLIAKKYVTQSEFDEAKNSLILAEAQVDEAKRQWDLAKEDLSKTQLISPFKGIISSIEVKDYAQVTSGDMILGLYSENAYELSFMVPAAIVNSIELSDTAEVVFSDLPGQSYRGHIKELGSRAAQVSAFPVVVVLDEAPKGLRAGMAAQVALNITLEGQGGFLIPLSCFYFGATTNEELASRERREAIKGVVYLFDPQSSTVQQHEVLLHGTRDNMVIVQEGLKAGDIIASAGVSYLHDGQQVKLLPFDKP